MSEAIHLRYEDITQDGLVIRCSKFRKSRLVPLHDTAQAAHFALWERRTAGTLSASARLWQVDWKLVVDRGRSRFGCLRTTDQGQTKRVRLFYCRILRPCRFGMYESEYRLALENAGFAGFRILLYQADQCINASSANSGLKLSLDFNMGALNMLNLGDVINDMVYQIRPYEVVPATTDQAIEDVVDQLSDFLETRNRYEILERTPGWISDHLARNEKLTNTLNTVGKILDHLYSEDFVRNMHLARKAGGCGGLHLAIKTAPKWTSLL